MQRYGELANFLHKKPNKVFVMSQKTVVSGSRCEFECLFM